MQHHVCDALRRASVHKGSTRRRVGKYMQSQPMPLFLYSLQQYTTQGSLSHGTRVDHRGRHQGPLQHQKGQIMQLLQLTCVSHHQHTVDAIPHSHPTPRAQPHMLLLLLLLCHRQKTRGKTSRQEPPSTIQQQHCSPRRGPSAASWATSTSTCQVGTWQHPW